MTKSGVFRDSILASDQKFEIAKNTRKYPKIDDNRHILHRLSFFILDSDKTLKSPQIVIF